MKPFLDFLVVIYTVRSYIIYSVSSGVDSGIHDAVLNARTMLTE